MEDITSLFDFKLVFTQIPQLLKYLPTTLMITLTAAAGSFILGFVIAMIKHKKIPVLHQFFSLYVNQLKNG